MSALPRLSLVQGGARLYRSHFSHDAVVQSIAAAQRAGYRFGSKVRLGPSIDGVVIGYNIGDLGLYYASRFPLLVSTALGVVKCALSEVCLLEETDLV